MDDDLVKELRDAGFSHDWSMYDKLCKNGYKFLGLPTLEELIEACGEKFYILKKAMGAKSVWDAMSLMPITATDTQIITNGSTPREAVARLWLALHANGNASA